MHNTHNNTIAKAKRLVASVLMVALCLQDATPVFAITYDSAASDYFNTVDDLGLSAGSDNISMRFGTTLGEFLRFNRSADKFILSNDLDVRGTLSGSALTIMGGVSYLLGNVGIGTSATPDAKLEVVGNISGSSLKISGTAAISGALVLEGGSTLSGAALRGFGLLTDCDNTVTSKLLWDSTTGRFSCGTDQSGGGSLTLSDADARYVRKSGGTMTGKLQLTNTMIAVTGSGQFTGYDVNDVVLTVKGAVSQTGNLQNWLDSNNTPVANITAAGNFNAATGQFSSTMTTETAIINGQTTLGSDMSDTIAFGGQVSTEILPNANQQYNFGADSNRWNYGYFTGLNVSYDLTAGNISTYSLNVAAVPNCNAGYHLATDGSGGVYCEADGGSSGGGMTYFNVSDGTTSEGISDAETINFADGTGIDVVVSGTDTVTINSSNIYANDMDQYVGTDDSPTFNNITVNGDSTLGSDASDNIAFNGLAKTSILNAANNTYSIGNTANRWAKAWLIDLEASGTTNLSSANITGNSILGQTNGSDIDANGDFISDLNPNANNTYNIGNSSNRWAAGWFNSLNTSAGLSVLGTSSLTGNVGIGAANSTTKATLAVTGTISGATVYATKSFSGAGLTDCDTGATSKLLWDATTGRFSCGTDSTAGSSGGGMDYATASGIFLKRGGGTMTGTLRIDAKAGRQSGSLLDVSRVGSGKYLTTSGASLFSTDQMALGQLDGGAFFGRVGLTQNQWSLVDVGETLTQRDSSRAWTDVALSADGKYQTATVNTGQIYTSSNQGVTWTARDSSRAWTDVALSSDGKFQTATVSSGQIYTSNTYGVTWAAKDSNRAWNGIAMSSDGKFQTATVSSGQIYTSSNYGVTWTARESSRAWSDVAMSSDGRIQTAVGAAIANFVSYDYGVTWTAKANPVGGGVSVSMSADGKTQVIVQTGATGHIMISRDYGSTFIDQEGSCDNGVAVSSDGNTIACTGDTNLSTSTDVGVTWNTVSTTGTTPYLAMNGDGKVITVVVASGFIYTSHANSYQLGSIGIGTAAPEANLHIQGGVGTNVRIEEVAPLGRAALSLYTASGTVVSKTAVKSGRVFGSIDASGHNGTDYVNSASIYFSASQMFNPGSSPSDIRFFNTSTGSTTITERMRIAYTGNVGIGSTAPKAHLAVVGTISGATVYATKSFSGAGLTDCDTAGSSKLLWDATTGRFSCGTDQSGSAGIIDYYLRKSGGTMTGKLTLTNTMIDVTGSGQFTALDGADVVLRVKGMVTQSGNLQEWVDANNSMYMNVAANGNVNALGNVNIGDAASDTLTVTANTTFSNSVNVGDSNTDNLTVYANAQFQNTVYANNNINLGDTTGDNISFYGVVNTNVAAFVNNTYNLGNSSNRWNTGWFAHANLSGDLNVLGNSSFTGNVSTNSSVLLGDGTSDNIYFGGDVNSSFNPDSNNTYNIGNSSNRWSTGWFVNGNFASDLTTTGNGTFNSNVSLGDNGSDTLTVNALIGSNLFPSSNNLYNVGNSSNRWSNVWTVNANATGDLNVANNVSLGDSNADNVSVNGDVNTSFNPNSNGSFDMGNSSFRWGALWANSMNLSAGLTAQGTAAITGNVGIGANNSTTKATLAVTGTISGATVYATKSFSGAGLTDCDTGATSKLLWDATTGRFSCGTDSTAGSSGGTYTAGQGLTLTSTSFKVNDTLTGTMLRFLTVSGALVKADRTLASSGTLTVKGTTTLGGNIVFTTDVDHSISIPGTTTGKSFSIISGEGSGGTPGGHLNLRAGQNLGAGVGGNVVISAGTGGDVGAVGGNTYILGGPGAFGGTAGHVFLGLTPGGTAVGNVGVGKALAKAKLDVLGTISGATVYAMKSFSGAGLTTCSDATTSKLLWNSTTGRFSCGTDQSAGSSGGLSFGTASGIFLKRSGGTMTGSLTLSGSKLTQTPSPTPATMSGIDLNANVNNVFAAGNYVYTVSDAVTGSEFRIMDVANPNAPVIVGGLDTGQNTKALYVSTRHAFVGMYGSGAGSGMYIIDVSNPGDPKIVSRINFGEAVNSIYVSGKYAYVGISARLSGTCSAKYQLFGGCDFAIVDFTDVVRPRVIGGLQLQTGVSQVYIQNRYAYLALDSAPGNDFRIIDLINPMDPVAVGGLDIGNSVKSIYASGKYAFAGINTDAGNEFRVIDVSNKTSPATIGGAEFGVDVRSISVLGDWARVGLGSVTGNDYATIDLRTPTSPRVYGGIDFSTNVNSVSVAGKYAYVGLSTVSGNDMRIVDLAGIDSPAASIGTLFAGGLTVSDNARFDNNAYVRNALNVGRGGIISKGSLSVQATGTGSAKGGTGTLVNAFDVRNGTGQHLFSVSENGFVQAGTPSFSTGTTQLALNMMSRRSGSCYAPLTTSTAMSPLGLNACTLVGATGVAYAAGNRMKIKYAPTNTASAQGGIANAFTDTKTTYRPKLGFDITTGTGTTGLRFQAAVTESSLAAVASTVTSAATGVDYAGMSWEDGISGTQWLCCSGDGTNHSCTSMGVTVQANTEYIGYVDWSIAGKVSCTLQAGSKTYVTTKTSNVSTASVALGIAVTLVNKSIGGNTGRGFYIGKIYLEQN